MKKRFCDVCEGEIRGHVDIVTEKFRIYSPETRSILPAPYSGDPIDICQSCIIEAIGKMYVAKAVNSQEDKLIPEESCNHENVHVYQWHSTCQNCGQIDIGEDSKERCVHGTPEGNECRECIKDEREVLGAVNCG